MATVSLADGGVDGYHVGVCATTPVTGAGAGCKVVVTQAAPSAGFTTGNLTIRGCINAGTNPVSHYDRFYYDYATNTIYFKTNNGANLDRELQFTSDLSTFTFGVSGQPSGSQVSYVVIDGLHWYYGFSPIHLATADYKNINHLTIRNCWFKACHDGPTLYGSYSDFENNLEDIIGGELRYVFYPSLGLYAYAANWQSHSLYMICFNSTLAGNFFGRNGGDAGGSFNGPNFVPAGQVNNGCVWQNNAFYTSSSQAAPSLAAGRS